MFAICNINKSIAQNNANIVLKQMEVMNMPRGDGTGPYGDGSKGLGRGPCGVSLRRHGRGNLAETITLSKDEQKKILHEQLKEIDQDKEEIQKKLKELDK